MDVAVSVLRSHFREWLGRAKAGEDVVVTDRGVPIARLVGMESTDLIERLTRDGVISKPISPVRTRASGRKKVKAKGLVSDLVSEQRR